MKLTLKVPGLSVYVDDCDFVGLHMHLKCSLTD